MIAVNDRLLVTYDEEYGGPAIAVHRLNEHYEPISCCKMLLDEQLAKDIYRLLTEQGLDATITFKE